MSLRAFPCPIAEAKVICARLHRHNDPPVGAAFAVAVRDVEGGDDPVRHCIFRTQRVRGVAIVGRPVAQQLQDGTTCEILRVATDGAHNACSLLYGACRRAADALGYRRVVTYTLAEESGSSLRAAGFNRVAYVKAAESWSRNKRVRMDRDLFGHETRPTGPKIRWEWSRQTDNAARAAESQGS